MKSVIPREGVERELALEYARLLYVRDPERGS
jgi:hypothetical protein